VFCLLLSSIYDQDLVLTTLGLVATTFTYDELGASGNVVGKALCTAAGYVSFEVGATTIIGMLCYFGQRRLLLSFADADN
jgi:hypothetical protein